MSVRTLARLAAPVTVAGVVTLLAAAPASAHVTVTPSVTSAGSYTVLTVALGHGCDGSATTSLEMQVPEEILSVTPARNPYWTAEPTIEKLDEPATDAHGNEVTERVATVVFTADPALPDGVRDSMEVQFQIPEDLAGETLYFPTVQKCEQGETAWVQIPDDGQDPHELPEPAPAFTVEDADGGGHGGSHGDSGDDSTDDAHGEDSEQSSAEQSEESDDLQPAGAESDESGAGAVGWAALTAGLLGLAAGGTALARSRRTS